MLLLLDRHADNADVLTLLLREQGWPAVQHAASLAEALRRLADPDLRHAIDVALVSDMLPEGGAEVIRALHELEGLESLPVLILTPHTEAARLDPAFAAGALDYIRMPYEYSELSIRIRGALRLAGETSRRREREAELQRDLDAAAALQTSLLPALPGSANGLAWGGVFQPASRLGGDLFNVMMLPDGRSAFFLLDVAGHGVPAALFCVSLHRLLSCGPGGLLLGPAGQSLPPDVVADALNQALMSGSDDHRHLTLVYGIHDSAAESLTLIQAGHPASIVLEAGGGTRIVDDGDPPLGLLRAVRCHSIQVPFAAGDRLVLYSDGITEAASATGELFAAERLLATCSTHAGTNVQTLAQAIYSDACAWNRAETLDDDASVFIIRAEPKSEGKHGN